jgi:hypothetical protein
MKNIFFSHQSISQRLAEKLQAWYKVPTDVIHKSEESKIIVNDLIFTVSNCKQTDKQNGQFLLTHNSNLIVATDMYLLVRNSAAKH